MPTANNEMKHLDALRIIAASAVVVLHYADYFKELVVGCFLVSHVWHFNLFVDLFFVVSGYVIASQYLGRVESPAAVGRFLWRRLARIYPLHLATLTFYVMIALVAHLGVASGDNPARYPFSDLPAQLLLLHAFDGARLTFNFPSWSLSAEMFCYLLFPIMAVVAVSRRHWILTLVIAAATANSVWAALAGTTPWADWINQGGAFRAVPAFALGVACHLYRDRLAQAPAIPGALVVALIAFMAFGWLLSPMGALAAVYAVALLAIQADCSGRATLVSTLHLDRWSPLTYSCYMLHIPVATVVISFGARLLHLDASAGKLILAPLAVVVLAAASVASLRWFETPLRRALTEAYDRRFARPAVASPLARQEALR
ncbi:acyltransferase [Bradyrhizobium jicamae]|uniref:acyltransferase family protein n=1 Tax=Bradyrhizobium jicamae TaxID=280332 RepID=UPI001BAE3016|nr:acyltransferase [Bradyrhizobium jicamae]